MASWLGLALTLAVVFAGGMLGGMSRFALTKLIDNAHAATFAAKSPTLMRLGKAAFLRAAAAGYHERAESAVDLVSTVFGTEDCREGLAAFAEKRAPDFSKVA